MHEMMNLYFFRLIPAPCAIEIHDSIFFLFIEFIFVEEFVLFVSIAKEESHLATFLAVSLSNCSVLDHGSERSNSSA